MLTCGRSVEQLVLHLSLFEAFAYIHALLWRKNGKWGRTKKMEILSKCISEMCGHKQVPAVALRESAPLPDTAAVCNWAGQLRWLSSFFRLVSMLNPLVVCIMYLVFFGAMSAKHMKHCWTGCGLNLLVCLNPTTTWHLPWSSRAVSSLLPYGQHWDLKISLISLVGLKLAQIYLDGAIILTILANYKSMSSDIAWGSKEECSSSR